MAAEGMRFTDCYAGSTVCAPSRCCLMTGMHTAATPGCAAMPESRCGLKTSPWPKVLKKAGYATGIIGKWGLGEPDSTGIPNRQGFDHWFGYLNQRHSQSHNYYPPCSGEMKRRSRCATRSRTGSENGTTGREESRRRRSIIRTTVHARRPGVPRPARPAAVRFSIWPTPFRTPTTRRANVEWRCPTWASTTDRDWPEAQKAHAAMISRMDSDVGQLLNRLRKLGIDRETVVFSPATTALTKKAAPIRRLRQRRTATGIKRSLHDGGIRVPMIVRWPGRVAPGSQSDLPWAFWDFLPTAAELAGAATPADLDGLSVVPTLSRQTQPEETRLPLLGVSRRRRLVPGRSDGKLESGSQTARLAAGVV